MAFGGDKEKRVQCPAGHSVRQDRLPYHLVKHGCDASSVAKHNPEKRIVYNADKKGRKMQRILQARQFKETFNIPLEGLVQNFDDSEETPAPATLVDTPLVDVEVVDETPTIVPPRPPMTEIPTQPDDPPLDLIDHDAEDDDDDSWGEPLFSGATATPPKPLNALQTTEDLIDLDCLTLNNDNAGQAKGSDDLLDLDAPMSSAAAKPIIAALSPEVPPRRVLGMGRGRIFTKTN